MLLVISLFQFYRIARVSEDPAPGLSWVGHYSTIFDLGVDPVAHRSQCLKDSWAALLKPAVHDCDLVVVRKSAQANVLTFHNLDEPPA